MLVLDDRGVIGPLRTGHRLDGMDQALFLFVEKNAEVVRAGLDVKPAMFLTAILFLERFGIHAQKPGNLFTFIRVDVDAPFTVAAFPAFFAIKGFHVHFQAQMHGPDYNGPPVQVERKLFYLIARSPSMPVVTVNNHP